ncbi:MAG TPA: LLM class flavin-dependent oxidoreductase, partial [Acidimicrobiales bacterium]|nr:LLM class flavin-dependent oxidoreductase [Acidimicrobiales bacterium]
PWVVLGAIAQATSTITIGTLITPVPRRRPQKLAKEAATLHALSGGRAVLGVGLGVPLDYEAYGEPVDAHERAALLDAGLAGIDEQLGDRRPPVWVAGRFPNPGPIARATRWDGYVPLLAVRDGFGLRRPDDVRAVRAALGDVPATFDIVTSKHWEHDAAEYAAAGVTWLTSSWNAEPGWVEHIEELAGSRPTA